MRNIGISDQTLFTSAARGAGFRQKLEAARKADAEKYKDTSLGWKKIYDNIHCFWMSCIGVVPPEFRPVSKSKDVQMRDKLNEYYIIIIKF